MRPHLALALVLALLTSGCLGNAGEVLFDCDTLDVTTFGPPLDADGRWARAAGEPIPLMVWLENVGGAELRVTVTTRPASTVVGSPGDTGAADEAPTDALLDRNEAAFVPLEIDEPLENGSIELVVRTHGTGDREDITCEMDTEQRRTFDVGEAREAPRAEGGKGVHVRTVGLWTDGPSFYTNMDRYHADPATPGGYLDPYNGSEPLPVYVYNDSADEMPERYNDSGYVTTIPGFNEALEDLPTHGGRLTYLSPEEGYTREGYEEHPLYGDPLVFYIEAVEVATVSCQVPQPVCTLPGPEDLPPVPPVPPSLPPGHLPEG